MLEVGLLLGVGILALALRAPNAHLIPAFTDETVEHYYSLQILQGQPLPLTAGSSYIGALWTWLVAVAYWVSGHSLSAPRTLILALGVLTVVATYPLGRTWGGRGAGLLAAALMGTAAGHIAVNSHVAWGNCATPLFSTLAIWASYTAVRGTTPRSGAALLPAGLCWGLAFQTHPSILAMLPGAVIFILWRGRHLLGTRWPYLGGGLFVLANLNLLIYNLTTGLASISSGLDQAANYTDEDKLTPSRYLSRVGLLLLGLFQNLGGAVDARTSTAAFLLDPGLWPVALLAMAGVLWQWRCGNPLPGLLLLGTVLMLPLLNDEFKPILSGRYLAPLLPVLYAAIGVLLAASLDRLGGTGRARGGRWSGWARLGQGLLGIGAAFLLLHPLLSLQAYYEQESKRGRTNRPILQVLEQISIHRQPDETVLIDRPNREFHLGSGSGLASLTFRLALALDNVPYRLVDVNSSELLDPNFRCHSQLIVMGSRESRVTQRIVAQMELHEIEPPPTTMPPPATTYRLYRLGSAPDAALECEPHSSPPT